MTQYQLLYPMLALVLLTFGVAVVLFRARKRSVREGHTPVSYFRTFHGSQEPEFLAQATRHFSNLFETPTLFYAGCLAAMVANVTDAFAVAVAWGYVAARCLHAWIHLRGNRLRHRVPVFFTSFLLLLILWIYICVKVAVRG